ncbi:MAG: hypothetical protein U9N53_00545, partial [Bacteroidota bacterium]|nr:hypothetical protein [Bacteroidota bacterium]
MLRKFLIVVVALVLLYGCTTNDSNKYVLIKGASLINPDQSYEQAIEIENSYILIKDGIIEQY